MAYAHRPGTCNDITMTSFHTKQDCPVCVCLSNKLVEYMCICVQYIPYIVYVVFQPQKGCGQWAGLTSEGSRVRGHRMAPPSSSCGHTPCTSPVATHTIAYGEGTSTPQNIQRGGGEGHGCTSYSYLPCRINLTCSLQLLQLLYIHTNV